MTLTPSTQMVVRYGKPFVRRFLKADPKIRSAFNKRCQLFTKDPYHPLLHNHALTGKYHGLHSINITSDWRALYREMPGRHGYVNQPHIIFETLGTHSQLYIDITLQTRTPRRYN